MGLGCWRPLWCCICWRGSRLGWQRSAVRILGMCRWRLGRHWRWGLTATSCAGGEGFCSPFFWGCWSWGGSWSYLIVIFELWGFDCKFLGHCDGYRYCRLFTSGGWIRMRGNWVNSFFESNMMWNSVIQLIRQIWFDMYSQREYYNHDITIWFDILHIVRYCKWYNKQKSYQFFNCVSQKSDLDPAWSRQLPNNQLQPTDLWKKVAIYKYSTVHPQKTSRSHMILTNTNIVKSRGPWNHLWLSFTSSTLGPQNHEKWRFYTPNIWVITPKNEGFGLSWYCLKPYLLPCRPWRTNPDPWIEPSA